MKTTANRAIEIFLIITFPLALFAGCADNGDPKTTDHQPMANAAAFISNTDKTDTETVSTMKLLTDTLNMEKMQSGDSASEALDQNTAELPDQDPLLGSDTTTTAVITEDQMKNEAVATPTTPVTEGKTMEVNLKSSTTNINKPTNSEPDLHIINFANDKTDVDNSYLAALKQHALFLKANPGLTLTISGHADSHGSHVYNEKLSLKRAEAIQKLLISDGAPESQLIVDSFGDSSPLHNKVNYKENRRVELEYMDAEKMHLSIR